MKPSQIDFISYNYNQILKKIETACAKSGKNPKQITLLAVSKVQSKELIEAAYTIGIRDFGENYVQELQEKCDSLSHLKDIRWHLIGHLQSNKAKTAIEIADIFQALDSESIAIDLAKRIRTSKNPERRLPVYIEVNIDDETNKHGVFPHKLQELIFKVEKIPELKLTGLMCIPEHKENPEDTRASFKKLRALRDTVKSAAPLFLSMGMSGDFEIAIEEGSDCVRIGTALFGERIKNE